MDAFVGSVPLASANSDAPSSQNREMHQLPHLKIPPLRDPLPPPLRKPPSPLEPNAGTIREPKYSTKSTLTASNQQSELPTVAGFLKNTAQSDKLAVTDPIPSADSPPKTVLPAFINLRAVEKLPYSSFEQETLPRKRRRVDQYADTFGDHLQLPIPKNQKEVPKQRPPFGPLTILNGLNEPPPNAALFPPIEPNGSLNIPTCGIQQMSTATNGSSIQNNGGRKLRQYVENNEKTVDKNRIMGNAASLEIPALTTETQIESQQSLEWANNEDDPKEMGETAPKSQRRKKARKWTDEETYDLLRGVVRCGVGNWASILAQSDLNFNDRTSANLKDRFRVCCSWAYQPDGNPQALADNTNNRQSGKIFLPDPRKTKGISEPNSLTNSVSTLQKITGNMPPTASNSNTISPFPSGTESSVTSEIPTASHKSHRKTYPPARGSDALSKKTKSTLIALGLPDPDTTVKANRRSRHPFSQAEDEALLKGYAVHGFQWTLIRQDKHLNLMHRKATDLRDRFRTKFPNAYREGGSATAKIIPVSSSNTTVLSTASDPAEGEKQGPSLTAPTSSTTKEHLQRSNFDSPVAVSRLGKGNLRRPSDSGTGTNTKACEQNAKTNPSSTPANDIFLSTITAGAMPIDPAMLPPAPPLSTAFAFTTIDDGTTSASASESTLGRSDDVTLPPLVWEELG
ncbi:MYB DNA-binding domain-containing protein [Trichophyton interdigitale]|uniref:MYB DNA-binding domain-containing protein n=1 Tax=Trichophyton interdigitale TaxID=101480 RepID=A0A9P4YGL0_9EURO|nr:MYB DNA-binding domain-containing protein [Trichophyton interdigitale]KAF3896609.1 MYB DNA-binding domain-containing protein [Trichophyton interdigitale]KAG8209396.1 MYB DNA-binding domain-containing protein [Trichophyton interdigitale]